MSDNNQESTFWRNTESWQAKAVNPRENSPPRSPQRTPMSSPSHMSPNKPNFEATAATRAEPQLPTPSNVADTRVNPSDFPKDDTTVTVQDGTKPSKSEEELAKYTHDPIEYTDSAWHYMDMMVVTIPIFMGYATLALMQRNVRDRLGIENGTHEARIFNAGVSFLYLGNLLFRLLHNFVFTFLRPRHRVYLSYYGIMLAMNLLGWLVFVGNVKHLSIVFISYLLGGISIGTFESNVISVLTPYGHRAKSWAVTGIPIGFNMIAIGGFMLIYFCDHYMCKFAIYMTVFTANVVGATYYRFKVKDLPSGSSNDDVYKFLSDLKKWREWLVPIWAYCAALTLDKFCLGLFGSIHLYMYTDDHLPVWPGSSATIPKNLFYCLYSFCCLMGDSGSRKIAYIDRARQPMYFLLMSLVGAILVLSKVLIFSLIGIILIFFANGSIYAHTTRRIDQRVSKRFNLIALSIWLFIGDLGSYTGSNLNSHIPRWISHLHRW